MAYSTTITREKIAYQTPSIEKVGEFDSLTQHSGTGKNLDANFPAGTPFSALTLS